MTLGLMSACFVAFPVFVALTPGHSVSTAVVIVAGILFVAGFFIIPWYYNLFILGVRHLRGDAVHLHDVFLDYRYPLRLVCGTLIISGTFSACDALAQYALHRLMLGELGSILIYLLGAWIYLLLLLIYLRFSFFAYLILDKGMGLFRALQVSYKRTARHTWKLLAAIMLMSALSLLLLIPFLVYIPVLTFILFASIAMVYYAYFSLVYATLYESIFK